MYIWRTIKSSLLMDNSLEDILNDLQRDGWEIFTILEDSTIVVRRYTTIRGYR